MRVFTSIEAWREHRRSLPDAIGFVPTMGALHDGHAALMQRSVAENAHTVLSIYLNETQFNNSADLDNYPRSLRCDLAMAQRLGVDSVITPSSSQMYADGFRYQVEEKVFANTLCGAHRPGHFTGVLTVVMKLLNLVRPQRAYFGEKDYQQYLLIRDMCEAFFLEVAIVPCETVREPDGLAMSSRNRLLNTAARDQAGIFNSLLRQCRDEAETARQLAARGFDVDYVVAREGRRYGAVHVECDGRDVRLIDNVALPM